jgi:hypothetical protein
MFKSYVKSLLKDKKLASSEHVLYKITPEQAFITELVKTCELNELFSNIL